MYIPKHFEQADINKMHELMHANPLATLVTAGSEGLSANHIPLHLTEQAAPYGLLSGHLPRANPLSQEAENELDAVAIFHGPHAYISPSWYASQAETRKFVPTWNYTAVHVHGRIRFIDDATWLRAHLDKFTMQLEAEQSRPWSMADAPADFIEMLLPNLIGIEIVIDKLEGKWKVSQNRSIADRNSAASVLEKSSNSHASAIAELMRREILE